MGITAPDDTILSANVSFFYDFVVPFSSTDRDSIQWRVKDSNLRRRCHQIYSLTPLATRETLRLRFLTPRWGSPPILDALGSTNRHRLANCSCRGS